MTVVLFLILVSVLLNQLIHSLLHGCVSCTVALLDDTELISTAGKRENIVHVLQKNGVINWERRCMIVDGELSQAGNCMLILQRFIVSVSNLWQPF